MALIRALKELGYGGRIVNKDETFEASPMDTRTLIATKRAELVVEEKAKAKPAKKADDDDDEPAKAAPPKQTYKTRRMTGRDND